VYPVETATALPGPDWLRARRTAAAERALTLEPPTFELEEWRYSPIDELLPGNYVPAVEASAVETLPELPIAGASATVTTVDGFLVSQTGGAVDGLSVGPAGAEDELEHIDTDDVFVESNAALSPDPIVIRVAAGKSIDGPVVITHHIETSGGAVFPRVQLEVGDDASIDVVEIIRSSDVAALVVPVTRISGGAASRVRYQQLQELGPRVWQLGSLVIEIGSQATFVGGVAAMGAAYGRLRTDCRLVGRGASGDLLALYFGSQDQTLDFRTFQDHLARDTTSNLLFKGVLDDSSKSIYTGLIRVSPEGAGTNAFQTNRNIKLSNEAWAESVPNLEIENNDVHCSHASTVSPVDAEQRFYLESRGVPTGVAERLIVEGFLEEVIAKVAVPEVASHISALVQAKLDARDV